MPGRTYTYADLATFPDDNVRREILDGELLVSPSPRLRHQRLVGRLYVLFANHLAEHGGGEVFIAPADVVLSDVNVLAPDVLFISDARRALLTEKNIQGPPDLVIEVLSNPRIDRVRKREIYERFGVPEYWVVDGEANDIQVDRLGLDSRYQPHPEIHTDSLTPLALPALTLDLPHLFRP